MTVNGTDSSWTNSAGLTIGYGSSGASTGILNIENSGAVSSMTTTLGDSAGGNGTLNLKGATGARGLLTTGYIKKGSGTAAFNFDGGILRVTGSDADFIRSFSAGGVDIKSGGAFIDTQAFNVGITTADVLSGSGSLTKQGTGTLTITGDNSYDGNTKVEAGTLQFDTYNQSASQTLGIAADSDASYGKLVTTGAATFVVDSKLSVDVASANTLAKGQTLSSVITAGTLNASTFAVSDNSALFNFKAVINGNAVDLTTVAGVAVADAVNNGDTQSATGAAQVLDTIANGTPTGDMSNVVTALGKLSTQGQVSQAVTQTLPLLSSGVSQVASGVLSSINRLVHDRQSGRNNSNTNSGLSGGDDFTKRAAWITPFGTRIDQDDSDGTSGFSANTWGMAGGIEGDLNPTRHIGIAYAYANSKVDGNTALSGTGQHVDIDSHVLAVYGSNDLANGTTLGWQADIGQNSNDGSRQIDFGGLVRTATADYKTYTAHVGTSLSKDINLNPATTFTPTVRADYTWLQDQRYQEQGAGALNLNVDSYTTDAFVLGVDGRFSHALDKHSRIEINAGVGYDAINQRGNVVAAYAGSPGQSFGTQGIDHSPWLMSGGVAYVLNTAGGTEISVRYNLDGRSDYLNQSASVKAKWLF